MISIIIGKEIKLEASNDCSSVRIYIKLRNGKWISKPLETDEREMLAFIIKVLYGYENE